MLEIPHASFADNPIGPLPQAPVGRRSSSARPLDTHRFQKRLLTLAIQSVLLFGAGTSHADTWNAGAGDWFVNGNWLDGSVPTGIDFVFIQNGGTAQVQAPGAQADFLWISGNSTLAILDGGDVNSLEGIVGQLPGSTGTATVDGAGSAWAIITDLRVGDAGNGSLTIQSGGSVNDSRGFIGDEASSTSVVTVDGTGSAWVHDFELYVGYSGTGALSIQNGGSVSNTIGSIGHNAGSVGTVTVDGAGSAWANSSSLNVGYSGSGTLTIQNGGDVSSFNGFIGVGPGSTGAVTVDGVGSAWTTNTSIYVGYFGAGTLTVQNGGSVHSTSVILGQDTGSGTLNIDGTAGARGVVETAVLAEGNGTGEINFDGGILRALDNHSNFLLDFEAGDVTINGGGAFFDTNGFNVTSSAAMDGTGGLTKQGTGTLTLTGNNAYTGATTISAGELVFDGGTNTIGGIIVEDGDLAIRNGGSVSNSGVSIGLSGGSTGMATVDGVGSSLTSDAIVVGTAGIGTLNILNGGSVTNTDHGYIGVNPGSTGTVVVDGAGSTWTNNFFTFMGYSGGDGILNIQNGGSFIAHDTVFIGLESGSTSTATVDGAGSTWISTDDLYVGDEGNGTLTIQNGGSASNILVSYIGAKAGSTGIVTVDGTGSSLTSEQVFAGYVGNGTLNILNGGNVSSIVGGVAVDTGSTGVATVDGAGSAWTNSTETQVGFGGNGTLNILNGGEVSNNSFGYVGALVGATGSVTVDGAGSTWTNGSDLSIGIQINSSGTLNILNGGDVSNSGIAYLGVLAGATGTVTVDGAGSTWVSNGNVQVGDAGDGTLTIRNSGSVSAASISLGGLSGGNGTLNIGSGGAAGILNTASIIGGTGTAILNFNHSDANYFFTSNGTAGGTAVTISGTTAVNHIGSGTTTLTGNNAYTGATTISAGELVFDGGTNTIGGIIVEDGDLAIRNDGSVSSTNGYIGYDVDSTATVTVDGTGSAWTNSGFLLLGGALGNGSLTIQNGGSVSNTIGYIGDWGGTSGTVTVDGIGSAWTNSNELVVGRTGNGSLTIQDGGSVSNTDGYIGDFYLSPGTVTVDGTGSAWTNSGHLRVGYSGNGTLTIQNGGSVSNILGHIGYFSTSTGTVTVDGAGSAWVNSSDLVVGLGGDGSLTIQNGGSVSNSWGQIGHNAGSTGTVTVDGVGSAWANSDELHVGVFGNGSLAIQNGGSVSSNYGVIGYFAGSTGTVTVDGAGSAWVNSSFLVGYLGNGSLAIQNGGSVSNADGYIGYLGGTTGTVTVDGAGSAWTNSSNLNVGSFGNGSLTIQNGGSVSAASIILGVFGGGGALNIGSGGAAGVLNTPSVTSGAGTATLNFNHSDGNYFFTNDGTAGGTAVAIIGTTSVNHIGSGTTTLTGTHTYTGGTTINSGILSVNGSIGNSTTTINTGGTLGGTGTVGNVTINGGTLAPGNSIGTLNVAGNVDFSGGGTYAVEVNAAGNSDLINATGTATLTNGTVLVIPEAGTYGDSTDYTILTAAGGLGGTTFDSVSSTLTFLTPTLSYDANNVFLNLTRNSTDYASVAGTDNQFSVATALDGIAASGATALDDLFNNLNILTADGANQAYDSLSGVQHTHGNIVALQSINQFKGILFDRIQGNNQFQANNGQIMLAYHDTGTMTDAGNQLLDGTVAPQRGWWLRATGNYGDIDDTRNATGANYKAGGIAAGLDFDLNPDFTAGAAVGYTRTDADVANGGLDVDSYQAALYGRRTFTNDYYLTGMTGVGFHNMDSNRNVTVGLLNTSAEADYDAWTGNVAIEAGRKFTLNASTSITPFAGLEYAHINRDSFTEKDGGVTNLRVNEDTQDSLRSSLGARITHSWITQGYRITPTAELAWIHEFMEDESGIRAGFATAPTTTFSVDGPDLDRDRARLALGLNVQLSNTAHLNLGYQGEFAGSDDRHDIAATFRMVW